MGSTGDNDRVVASVWDRRTDWNRLGYDPAYGVSVCWDGVVVVVKKSATVQGSSSFVTVF